MHRPRTRLNIAAVAGRWSAQHRRTAILGWLGFVLVAFIVVAMLLAIFSINEVPF